MNPEPAACYRPRAALFGLVASLTLATAAHADCVDGVRAATAAELDFAQRATAALIAGLPEAVRPLERRSASRPDPAEVPRLSACRDTPVGAFSPATGVGFMYDFPPAEATARSAQRRQLQRQIEELEKLPPDQEAQRKEIEAQMRAAYAAAPTRSRKDPPFTPEQQAQADRANTEGRRLEQAARQVQFDHNARVKPQTDALRVRADELQQGPQIFSVGLEMNVQQFPQGAGNRAVLTFGAPSAKRSAALQPRNIVVTIEGPAGPAREALLGLIDRDYLQGLLDKPAPGVPVSRQRIESSSARAAAAAPLVIASSVPLGAASSAPPAVAAPAATAAGTATPTATAGTAPSAARDPCPPAATVQTADATRTGSQVGAEVGGAAVGGGWGRNLGSAIGGALGALGGTAKKTEAAPVATVDCPR
ncbi:MAG: hypothetical protein ACK5TK_04890 [Betaproteobacteria bacterium]